MGKIRQEQYFDSIDYTKHENSGGEYYLGKSGRCYRVIQHGGWFILRKAGSLEDAQEDRFETVAMVDEGYTEEKILSEIELLLKEQESDTGRIVSLDELKWLLFLADPEGLRSFPILAPGDEYDSEAEVIYDRLMDFAYTPSVFEIAQTVKDVFDKWLGTTGWKDELMHLAYSIRTGKVHPCPVCGKNYFWGGECDICPECGWEDDPVQFNDLHYRGGANLLSAMEKEVEYLLAKEEKTRLAVMKLQENFLDKHFDLYHGSYNSNNIEDNIQMKQNHDQYIRNLIHLYGVRANEEEPGPELEDWEKRMFYEVTGDEDEA